MWSASHHPRCHRHSKDDRAFTVRGIRGSCGLRGLGWDGAYGDVDNVGSRQEIEDLANRNPHRGIWRCRTLGRSYFTTRDGGSEEKALRSEGSPVHRAGNGEVVLANDRAT
jgi:hypothetical protein